MPRGVEVLASAGGLVTKAVGGTLNEVNITHPDGSRTVYLHLNDVSVNANQQVRRGQVLGHVGCTGFAANPIMSGHGMEPPLWQADAEVPATHRRGAGAFYGPAPLGSSRGISVIGNPAQGAQTGDRTLAGGRRRNTLFQSDGPAFPGQQVPGPWHAAGVPLRSGAAGAQPLGR